jgi:hypothetical protein
MAKTFKTQEERTLDPLDDINPHVLMGDFERLAFEQIGRDHGEAFVKVASAAMQVNVEIGWPSIRKLAQRLRDEGPIDAAGWRFATTAMPGAHEIAITAERDDQPGGWLYTCVISADKSPAGLEDDRLYREKRKAEGASHIDIVLERLRGEAPRVTPATHPEFYLSQDECKRVSNFSACAYPHNGGMPLTYDRGYAEGSLEEIKASTKFDSAFIPSAVVNVRPSLYLTVELGELASNPDIPTSDAVSDIPAAMDAMGVLTLGLRAAGLSDELRERAASLAQTRYEQYGEEYSRTLASIGAGTAFRYQGNVADKIRQACTDVWSIAAGADATHGRDDFGQVVRMLEANGHVSRSSEYDCNDMDNFCFVERLEDRQGILWIRSQHAQYRVDFLEDHETALPRWLTISAQREPDDDEDFEFSYEHGKVSPEHEGFLARFRWDDGDERFVMNYSGPFHSRTIKNLNDVLFSVRSVSCCLEQDYPNDTSTPNA